MSREKVFDEIKKYTKEDILLGLEKVLFSPDSLLKELPIAHYNRMCNEALKISKQATKALEDDNLEKFSRLFNQSSKIWKEANDFFDEHIKKLNREQEINNNKEADNEINTTN